MALAVLRLMASLKQGRLFEGQFRRPRTFENAINQASHTVALASTDGALNTFSGESQYPAMNRR